MVSFYPSQIIEFLYCPRYTYFEYVLRIPQYEDKYYKVEKGRHVHDMKLGQNKDYIRKRIGVVKVYADQYLGINGLRGKVDEVLQLDNGSFAPLDYKFAIWNDKIYETYKQQLFCYAMLIEANFNVPVDKGFLVYIRSKHKLVTVEIKKEDKEVVKQSMSAMSEIIIENKFPKATKFKKRCVNCTYRNICVK